MTQMSGIIIAVLHKNHIWSYDFVQDRLANGKKIRILTVIDEYTRKCLKLKVGYSLKSDAILESLADLFFTEGIPEYIRSDNGCSLLQKRTGLFATTPSYHCILSASQRKSKFSERVLSLFIFSEAKSERLSKAFVLCSVKYRVNFVAIKINIRNISIF